MPTSIGPADVKLSGGLYVHGAQLVNAKLTFLGASPNARVKLYDWDPTARKFTEFDALHNASVSESDVDPAKVVIQGVSRTAQDEGVGFAEADCIVTWDVKVTGRCDDCS